MSAQLFNPKSKKLVNVEGKQIPTLKKAGWLEPNDEKVAKALKEVKEVEEKTTKKA